jgi:hypothetical protein
LPDPVVAIFVRHVPIGQDDYAWRKPFALPTLLRRFDFEVDVVSVFELFVEVALEPPIGPFGVVLDDLLEVVEEFAVRVYPCNFYVRASVPYEITLEE